jgi:hypothetical protein
VGVNASLATYTQQATVHHAAPQQRLHGGWWLYFIHYKEANINGMAYRCISITATSSILTST